MMPDTKGRRQRFRGRGPGGRLSHLLVWMLVLLGLAGQARANAAQDQDHSALCGEMAQAGYKVVSSGQAYGVPYITIEIPVGFSITSFCRQIPSFSRHFQRCRNSIAFFNALHPSYIKTGTLEPFSIESDTLKVPLDFAKVPEIFPPFDRHLAAYNKYLLADIGKGFLAYYVQGELKRVYPLSAGAPGKDTPLFHFEVQAKFESYWSTIYDTWMPWALLLKRPYYIHGGALPGKNDSAGCIRLFTHHAKELFHLVEVGTPGRIIHTPKLENPDPANLCP